MKKLHAILLGALLVICFGTQAVAAAEPIDNVRMSADGTLEATFTMDELVEKGNLLIYENSSTGYKARVTLENSNKNAFTASFNFEDGDAFFGFKADLDMIDDKLQLTAIHSKAATLPHRKLVEGEYSSLPYGEIGYMENGRYYYANAGYVTEIREFVKKSIIGQGVSITAYENGTIYMQRNVLDTATKGGYSARTVKEIIGSHSKEIIIAVAVIGWLLLKNVSMESVAKNSAELINKKET